MFPHRRGKKILERICKPGLVIALQRVTIIPLGRQLPDVSSSLPESRSEPSRLCSLFGLAPGGVYRAKQVTLPAGALLPHHFTLTGEVLDVSF